MNSTTASINLERGREKKESEKKNTKKRKFSESREKLGLYISLSTAAKTKSFRAKKKCDDDSSTRPKEMGQPRESGSTALIGPQVAQVGR